MTPGTYWLEGYQTGTFWGEEFWASQQVTVSNGQTASATLTRNEPYASGVKFYNNATNQVITAGQQVAPGTVVRAEVTVKNSTSSSQSCTVRLALDRDKASGYDSDQTSGAQTVSGNNGTKVFSFTYTTTASVTGQFYYALEVKTMINGNAVRTDSWGWGQTFRR